MENKSLIQLSNAVQDFRYARRRAALQEVLARIKGEPTSLLSFEEVSRRLKAKGKEKRGLEDIPLDAIVGSVGRYDDFNRKFFPLRDSDKDRWAQVKVMAEGGGLPPIDVYKIGEAYFVLDGNHRVSVARKFGSTHIEAYVTEIKTKVPLSPDDELDDIILKAEYVDFLNDTRLDEIRPHVDLTVTLPGRFREMREHIAIHQLHMQMDHGREVPFEETVADWADHVYLPIVQAIREGGILRDFPGRTEADLYVWLMKHRSRLAEALGWEVQPDEAVADLAERFSNRPGKILARFFKGLRELVVPAQLDPGPPPGKWRRRNSVPRDEDRLFSSILVPLSGEASGWVGLDQALIVVRREGARLRGLHVVASQADRRSERVKATRAEFDRRCEAAGVEGEFVVEVGEVALAISERARWNDLVVVNLFYPPGDRPLERLRSGFRTLVQRSPRPVLAVKGKTELKRALLAYDGSPKAEEALYLAAYAGRRWGTSVTVVTVAESGRTRRKTLDRARGYLRSRGVRPECIQEDGPAGDAILRAAGESDADFIIMGGYGTAPVLEVVLGSTVDQILREFDKPVLICR